MPSYWIESNLENEKKFPKLNENKQVDVCIIGGGLTGLSCAYYLSKTNLKIAILEKSKLCYHTSRKFYSKNNQSTWSIL